MDLNYTADELAFRDEVRKFTAAKLPKDIKRKVLEHRRLTKDDTMRWQDILAKKGWLTGHWPKQFGGLGWSPVEIHIFDEETRLPQEIVQQTPLPHEDGVPSFRHFGEPDFSLDPVVN